MFLLVNILIDERHIRFFLIGKDIKTNGKDTLSKEYVTALKEKYHVRLFREVCGNVPFRTTGKAISKNFRILVYRHSCRSTNMPEEPKNLGEWCHFAKVINLRKVESNLY